MSKEEIIQGFMELAKEQGAENFSDFVLLSLCSEEIRESMSDDEMRTIYVLNSLLTAAAKLPTVKQTDVENKSGQ